MTDARDVPLPDGRVVRAYAAGPTDAALTVVWHHGSPQTGALLQPLLDAGRPRGIRWVSVARPGYSGSTFSPGRDVASVAGDIAAVADAYAVGSFAVAGASGGGPHALACSALLGERVTGVVCFAGVAPFSDVPWWWDGMQSPGGLRAAVAGREARLAHAEVAEFDPAQFGERDWAALDGEWAPLGQDAQAAGREGADGATDDDVAFTQPWGFELRQVQAPVLLVQGGEDRVIPPAHAPAQLAELDLGELWLRPRDGHVSVLRALPVALDWLLAPR
ncbi:pimeloyl-ACP methyl ester carboxylesterase [Motilibacter rhizosphaerae]|uniref:Pimeloyl-ACP methyl ester carboxylesterase n=1 Tax=Motilibacter rhizosphaerae TaxID=598652 RepID=A0A4Q7NX60_9ACTN|nr:alpha/beta hydrolase [Motilibacter rhizosphaerae]RZS91845.1 pimeloyl-ACP methyl ester carboxylesterase [Motilibacter rhizosphaerae]